MARLGGATYRVGDTFKLGQSSRLYLLGGPEQMMPEEGLSREQRKQLRIMQVCSCGLGSLVRAWASPQSNNVYEAVIAVPPTTLLSCWTVSTLYVGRQSGSRSVTRPCKPLVLRQATEARKEEEVRIGRAQMDAALASGASWGFGEDAKEELVEGEEVEWRTYAETHSLTDNQVRARTHLIRLTNSCPGGSKWSRLVCSVSRLGCVLLWAAERVSAVLAVARWEEHQPVYLCLASCICRVTGRASWRQRSGRRSTRCGRCRSSRSASAPRVVTTSSQPGRRRRWHAMSRSSTA